MPLGSRLLRRLFWRTRGIAQSSHLWNLWKGSWISEAEEGAVALVALKTEVVNTVEMALDSYMACVVAAAGVGSVLFAYFWRGAGLAVDWRLAAIYCTTAALGLVGGRGYILVEQWRNGAFQPGWIDGGFRLPGAVMGLVLGMAIGRRVWRPDVSLGRVFDIGALAGPFALAVARFGCLAAGCCFGRVSELPWAVRFARDSQAGTVHQALHLLGPGELSTVPVHPLAVYFMLWHLAVGGFLLWFRRRQRYDGQLLLLGLLLGQGGKALLETLRQPIPGAPALYLSASGAVLAGAAAIGLVVMARRGRLSVLADGLPDRVRGAEP